MALRCHELSLGYRDRRGVRSRRNLLSTTVALSVSASSQGDSQRDKACRLNPPSVLLSTSSSVGERAAYKLTTCQEAMEGRDVTMRPRERSALSSRTGTQGAMPARGAVWRHRRATSRAISFGRKTNPTHRVSMALMGMLGKRADPGYCASVAPPACLRACMPRAPSEPSPERTTPIALWPRSFASEVNRISPG